ncbi:hypothetical protein AB7Y08_18295 [Citrobacter freundii]|uniref:hypothetical protein n=1 Tax=Citrobacter freundii TaxID=546 RepID=UPI0034E5DDBA
MTTNHPAHGPVSLERLHQISEILSKAAAQSDGGNLGYAMADAVKLIDEVINAEPVAYMTYKGYLLHAADPKLAEYSDPTPLYDAPSAPVVPDEKPMPEASKIHAIDAVAAIAEVRGWNACRAAMLQAGNHTEQHLDMVDHSGDTHKMVAGNSPVIGVDLASGPDRTVEVRYVAPPGYVMVPKEMTDAIGEAIAMQANCCGGIALDIYDAMLAAAPQQEVKSALEHGMRRYAGAMQKLSEGDK